MNLQREKKIDVVGGEGGVAKFEKDEPEKQQSSLESNYQEPFKEESGLQIKVEIETDVAEPTKQEQTTADSESQVPNMQELNSQEIVQKSPCVTPKKRQFDSTFSCQDCPGTSNSSTSESLKGKPSAKRLKTEKEGTVSEENGPQKPCQYRDLQKRNYTIKDCSTFWPSGWRKKLCSCTSCLSMYEKEGVAFLVDLSDTVSAYEEKGQTNESDTSDSEMVERALSRMDRVQMIEVIRGYNNMSKKLLAHLKTYAEAGKVVKKEDITSFFEEMTENRKKKMMPSIPHFSK